MITSMTGFGRGEVRQNDHEIVAEIRSLNNRFLDIQLKLPRGFSHFEPEVKNIVRNYVTRGRINVLISIKSNNGANYIDLTINKAMAQFYWRSIQQLKKELKIPGKININHLLQFPDIVTYDEDGPMSDELWESMKTALSIALASLQEMRKREGEELSSDLRNRIQCLEERLNQIEGIAATRMDEELQKLRQRIKEIVADQEIDPSRLETEIALMINRIDVTEECVRFRSHNKMFLEMLSSDEDVGRKMNFLLQEMTREANTIGAKANHADIAHLVVEIKEEVEKIREQVQNIE